MKFNVRVKREKGENGIDLPYGEIVKVQELLQVLAASELDDLLVEVRFGRDGDAANNGKVEDADELSPMQRTAKYTYG